MKKIWLLIIIMVLFSATAEAKILKMPLYKLSPVDHIDLQCIAAERSITIPIPERWKVNKATLSFAYMNSSGLLKNKSRIVVKLNGKPLKQINLHPIVTEGKAVVALPTHLLEAGYNDLTFAVSQHYTDRCELPCANDLWTTLKLDEGDIEIDYSLKEVPLKLSAVNNFLFDPKETPEGKVNIIIEKASNTQVNNAAITASAIARKFDYKKVSFNISEDITPGYDNILIGEWEYVKYFLDDKGVTLPDIKGPFLKVIHLPTEGDDKNERDETHALLVVSGLNDDQVMLAAETLAIMSFPYPDTDELTALEFRMPEITQYGGRSILETDKTYDFKTLNFPNQTLRGINPGPRRISFRLPADFFVKQNMYAELSLHFAYGANLRSDSALHISINGKEIRAIPLDSPSGAVIEGYKLSIPTFLFQAGTNSIDIRPMLTPLVTKDCELIQTEYLFLSLFETSTLKFPPMPHLVKLPKLELFALNGFPFTRWPDGFETMIYLTDPEPSTVASALNLIGMITQKNGYPLIKTKVVFEKPENWDGELLVIGKVKDIPEEIMEKAPLRLSGEAEIPYPVVRSWEGEEEIAFSKQISGLGSDRGVMMQLQSPYKTGRSVIIVTATTSKGLATMSDALLEPSVHAQTKGDVLFVELTPPDYKVESLNVGQQFFTGKSGQISKLNYYLHSYPVLYYIALVLAILALAAIIFYLLSIYLKKRVKRDEAHMD